MSPLKHILSLGQVLTFLGLMSGSLLTAAERRPEKANWDNLKKLAPGDEIRVVLNNAKSYQGKLQTLSDEAIVVRTAKGEQTFTRENILRVSAKGVSHRTRNTLIGAAVGFGAGLAVGAAVAASRRKEWPQNRYTEAGAVVGLVVYAPLGAGLGALMPTGRWHEVYRAH